MADFAELVAGLRAKFATGETRTLEWRLDQLNALKRCVFENQDRILESLAADLGRHECESVLGDLAVIFSEIDTAISKLSSWMKPVKQAAPSLMFKLDTLQMRTEPLGVVLQISPWNYPAQLCLAPLASAIAAGNCVVVKPSEISENVSATIADILPQYLDTDAITVVTGGVPETTALLAERFDKIAFTGNPTVGRIVMQAAAKHLTPVVLELGGKSPTVIAPNANLETAARRVAWGRFLNVGQTCIAPDYVLLTDPAQQEPFLEHLSAALIEYYGENPLESESYGRMVNARHHQRVMGIVASALEGGATVAHGDPETADEEARFIPPLVFTDVDLESRIMQEEIFGPLLPIIQVDGLAGAIDFINAREKPLALYVFAGNKASYELVLQSTSSGTVCVNDVIMQHGCLPFGGVGNSGMGKLHGETGYRTFSHERPVMIRSAGLEFTNAVRYPPYDDSKISKLKWATGYPSSLDKGWCSIM